MTKTVIFNTGRIASGDIRQPILDADTILIENGKIAKIGGEDDIDIASADIRIDADQMVITPGLIDPHLHNVIGDWTPIQHAVDWMAGYLLAGVTTMLSQGENNIGGLPMDPVGNRALAILGAKTYKNYRPGGAQKVHGGALMLVDGLTKHDFEEMSDAGVWLIAEIGGAGLSNPEKVAEMVEWAHECKWKVNMHLGPTSIPLSSPITAADIKLVKPDIACHINGGSTATTLDDVKKLVDETDVYLELIFNGNPRACVEIVDYIKKKQQEHRIILGSDTPTGNGLIPTAIWRIMLQIASLNRVSGAEVIAYGTGNTARAYGLNTSMIEVGREADILAVDKPLGSQGRDALEALEVGDVPGTGMIVVDGRIVALRGRDTRNIAKAIKVNGVEKRVTLIEDYLWGPWRFSIDTLSGA